MNIENWAIADIDGLLDISMSVKCRAEILIGFHCETGTYRYRAFEKDSDDRLIFRAKNFCEDLGAHYL